MLLSQQNKSSAQLYWVTTDQASLGMQHHPGVSSCRWWHSHIHHHYHHHYYHHHYHHYQSSHQARAAEHHWVEALGLRELYEGPVLGLLTSADDAGVRPPGLEEAEPEQRAGQDEHDGVERRHEHLEVK